MDSLGHVLSIFSIFAGRQKILLLVSSVQISCLASGSGQLGHCIGTAPALECTVWYLSVHTLSSVNRPPLPLFQSQAQPGRTSLSGLREPGLVTGPGVFDSRGTVDDQKCSRTPYLAVAGSCYGAPSSATLPTDRPWRKHCRGVLFLSIPPQSRCLSLSHRLNQTVAPTLGAQGCLTPSIRFDYSYPT